MDVLTNAASAANAIKAVIALVSMLLIQPIWKYLLKPWIQKRKEKMKVEADFRADVSTKLNGIVEQIGILTEDVAMLQGDKLNRAHEFYMVQGWCPAARKRELQIWYDAYTRAGHNHLASHYLHDLLGLPESPEPIERERIQQAEA